MDVIKQFPHCDMNVLHRPSTCEFCDLHPEWQQLREVWGINFTGETDPAKAPCPSARFRHHRDVHAWGGNRPTRVTVLAGQMSIFDAMAEDDGTS